VLNFIATDKLQLYKIFKITRVSFFGTHCSELPFKFMYYTPSWKFLSSMSALSGVRFLTDLRFCTSIKALRLC